MMEILGFSWMFKENLRVFWENFGISGNIFCWRILEVFCNFVNILQSPPP